MPWRPIPAVIGLLLLAGMAMSAVLIVGGGAPSDPISRAAAPLRYDLTGWEVRHLLNRWLYKLGHLFDDGPSLEEENDMIQRYFALGAEVASLKQKLARGGEESLPRTLEAKGQEQERLENKVEAILEKRVSQVIEDEGLTTSLPLFSDVRFVFPPLDFEFDQPPQVLAISPRERISLERAILVRSGLSSKEVSALEEETAASGMSSVVLTIGGVATYPSALPEQAGYEQALETIAHEWLHHYLFFHPLGGRYFQSETLRALNETVANMGGHEIAQEVRKRFPLPQPPGAAAGDREKATAKFKEEMHALRLAVDRLLGEGRIDEAEALMEEKRKSLAEDGFYIRKINQAYFAFNGLYADTPASSSPLGPKLLELRQRTGSVGEFIRTVAEITSEEDLDRLLAETVGGSVTPP